MYIINELNLRSCRTYFQKAGKAEHASSVNLGRCRLKYHSKLLETEKTRYRKTYKASLSGLQAIMALRTFAMEDAGMSKVLTDRMFTWQETKLKKSRRDFTGKRTQKT